MLHVLLLSLLRAASSFVAPGGVHTLQSSVKLQDALGAEAEALHAIDLELDAPHPQRSSPADKRAAETKTATALRAWMHSAGGAVLEPLCARAKAAAEKRGRPWKLLHPIATWPTKENSRLNTNIAAMRHAKEYAAECGVEVTLMRVYNAVEPPHPLPNGFVDSPSPLTRTAIDAMDDPPSIAAARDVGVPEFPLIQGLVEQVIAAGGEYEWLVLSNADVMPFPGMYVKVALLSDAGPDVLTYTRMGVPEHVKRTLHHQPKTAHFSAFEKYLQALRTPSAELMRHPGIDGFGVKIDLVPCIDFGSTHWGCAPFGQLVWSELRRVSQSCAMWISGHPGGDAPSITRFTVHPAEDGWRRRLRLRRRRLAKTKVSRYTKVKWGAMQNAFRRHGGTGGVGHHGLNARWGVCMNHLEWRERKRARHAKGGPRGHVDSLPGKQCVPKRAPTEAARLKEQCTTTWHAKRNPKWGDSIEDSPLTGDGTDPVSDLVAFFHPKPMVPVTVRWDLGVAEALAKAGVQLATMEEEEEMEECGGGAAKTLPTIAWSGPDTDGAGDITVKVDELCAPLGLPAGEEIEVVVDGKLPFTVTWSDIDENGERILGLKYPTTSGKRVAAPSSLEGKTIAVAGRLRESAGADLDEASVLMHDAEGGDEGEGGGPHPQGWN